MNREEMIVELRDRKLIYEECSSEEVLFSKHTIIICINQKPIKYFRLKKIKEILIGKKAEKVLVG